MQCGHCGASASEDQRFCGHCGQPLVSACANCGAENPPDNRFCGSCGAVLDAGAVPTGPAHTVPSVERRMVSVLFVDLVGFTSFSEGRDPEDVRSLITRYFDVAREVIERFGGTVDKYIGDAVMAWWGATRSQEDDAERAVRAAMELVDRVATLGETEGIPGLAARAAVMTGAASVGPGGNERGLLLGDLVNSASRLQTLATPGATYIGAATAGLVSSAIETVDRGRHQVKGRDEPIHAFEAIRMIGQRRGKGRSEILEPPFVGRLAELRLLKDALHAAGREGRARFVSLIGQAGIGKSRLIWEFQKYTDGVVEDVYWHEGRSPAYGEGLALWALAEMVRRRAGIQDTDDTEASAALLAETVAAHVEPADQRPWVEQRLASLLGIGDADVGERAELYSAARTFFEGLSSKGTTVLVFEDLHWADPGLLEFIEELPDWSQNHPILVVTLARPDLLERRPDWGTGRRGFASTYLGPLADPEMRDLVVGAVGALPGHVVERIVDSAGGVPLFAVEMLRMLVADGRLVLGPGGAEVSGDLGEVEVPTSVQAIVSARLDRLDQTGRDLARDAAVLGHAFTLEGLAILRDEETDKLERRLADLVRRELLELVRDSRSPDRGQYRWVQSVVREVAYSRISREDRRDLHLRVARYFRDLDDQELAPVAAGHFVAASRVSDDPALEEELVASLRAALGRATTLHADEQVISLVETAVPVVDRDMEFELRELAVTAAVHLFDVDTAERHVEAVRALAAESDDVGLTHRAMALVGLVGNELLRSHWVKETLEPHIAAHPDLTEDPYLARAAIRLARARGLTGDMAGAVDLAEAAVGAAEVHGLIGEVADGLVTWGTSISDRSPLQAVALLRGAIDLCRRHGFTDTMIRGLINIGFVSWDLDVTIEASQEAFETSKRIGDRNHGTFVARNLSGGFVAMLELDRAEAVMSDPVVSRDSINLVGDRLAVSHLAMLRGDDSAARSAYSEAVVAMSGFDDTQVQLGIENQRCMLDFFGGEYRTTIESKRAHFERGAFARPDEMMWWLLAAALDGDDGVVSEVAPIVDRFPASPVLTTMRAFLQGMVAVAEGRTDDAATSFAAAADSSATHGVRRVETMVLGAAAARLGAQVPEAEMFRSRARAIAAAAGADGIVRWLDSLL